MRKIVICTLAPAIVLCLSLSFPWKEPEVFALRTDNFETVSKKERKKKREWERKYGPEIARTDGPDKVLHREFLMTQDPKLGRIPSERLETALQATTQIEQAMLSSRTAVSNINWSERGPNNVGGRTRAILIDASDATGNTIWAGSVSGGLWKTTNFKSAGTVWNQVSGVAANLAITCIAQDPVNPLIIYLGTGEGYGNIDAIRGLGIYRSSDGGVTWSLIPSTTNTGASAADFVYVQKLLVNTNGDLYAAGRSNFCNRGGILRLPFGSTAWTRVIGTYTSGGCAAALNFVGMDLERSASGDLYATTMDYSTGLPVGRLWKSPAGATVGDAATWTDITPTGSWRRIEIECSSTDNNKIYALLQGNSSAVGGLRRSINGGGSWTNINIASWCDAGTASTDFTRGQAWYDLTLGVAPGNDALVFAGGVDIFKSTNSGTAWTQNTQWASGCGTIPNVHADIHAIEFYPGSSTEFIVGNDGGIYYSADGGTTYTVKNTGYNVTQYYSVALYPTAGSNYLLAGAQDNGTHKFTSAGINTGVMVTGGDGGHCFIDADNPNVQLTAYTGASLNLSSNGGSSFSYLGSTAVDRFINPADYESASNNLYCGGPVRQVLRFFNLTTTPSFVAMTVSANANLSLSAIRVNPNLNTQVWAAFSTADGVGVPSIPEFYKIDNASTAPVATAITLPAAVASAGIYISSLDIEDGNSNHIVLAASNYGVNNVWETLDGGATWTAIDGNLPDMPVRAVKFTPAGSSPNARTAAIGGILIGTETGVWATNLSSGAATIWEPNNAGMGNVRIDNIQLRPADRTIAVATHGRGVFTGTFNATLPIALQSFSGKDDGKVNLLEWTTSSELNSKDFEIEKSTDGISYYRIGTVRAAGTSQVSHRYEFRDAQVHANNFYRLKMNDLDGRYKRSQTVAIQRGVKQQMWVVNNPFGAYLDLRFARRSKSMVLQLFSLNGTRVAEKQLPNGQEHFRWQLPASLNRGMYVLKATIDGEAFSFKVFKK